ATIEAESDADETAKAPARKRKSSAAAAADGEPAADGDGKSATAEFTADESAAANGAGSGSGGGEPKAAPSQDSSIETESMTGNEASSATVEDAGSPVATAATETAPRRRPRRAAHRQAGPPDSVLAAQSGSDSADPAAPSADKAEGDGQAARAS